MEDEMTGKLIISYEIEGGGFIQRIPPGIIEYGYNDSFVVARTRTVTSSEPVYYIINRTKDSDFAEAVDYLAAPPLSQTEYISNWLERLKIDFIKTKE